MKLTKLAGALSIAALVVSGAAQAAPVNVAGVTWDPDGLFDFGSTSSLIENVVTTAGGELSGFGVITQINGLSNFCAGCELTYTFSGYTLNANYLPNPDFAFSGGVFNFYVSAVNANFSNIATFSDGTPWLKLVGADPLATGATLAGSITNFSQLSGEGSGYLDVDSGLAAAYFDTNSRDGADFFFTSSFQPILTGPVSGKTHFGSANIAGDSQTVPEPSALALLGLGLAGLGMARRNKKSV